MNYCISYKLYEIKIEDLKRGNEFCVFFAAQSFDKAFELTEAYIQDDKEKELISITLVKALAGVEILNT